MPAVGIPEATDNCAVSVVIVYQGETRTDGPCPDTYSLLRRWTATDNCGNTAFAEQRLTVQDITKPVFTFVPADVTVNCQDVPAVGVPTAVDNCTANVSIVFVGETRTDGACTDSYVLVRRWTATDNCGNSVSAEQKIIVQDITLPAFTFVPANITVECDAVPALGQPTATDNCATSVQISFVGETRTDGACPDTYSLVRRWTATDNCGNEMTAMQTIVVRDVTPPIFSFVPPDATVNCEAVPAIGTPVVADNCDQNVNISVTTELQTGSNCSTSGVLIRRWTAVDNCGNSVVAEQRLTVQDTTKPVFTLVPGDLTVSCANVPAVGMPAATDNCTSNVSIVYDGEQRVNGSCPDTYTLIRRWTATDVCGNVAMAEQVIAVQDLTAPVFTFVPGNTTVSCESVPTVGTPSATDDCDADVSIVFNGETRTDGFCPDTYSLLRKWTVTDNCGNSATATQTIIVRDLTAPMFTFVPASVTASCEAVPPVATPVATDNCDAGVSIVFDGETRVNGNCPDSYTLTRRWTATDNCGNSVSAEQVVTVQDNSAPVFTFVPANATISCDAVPQAGSPIVTDNCTAGVPVVYEGETRTNGSCPDTYTLTRRWRATDNCGNATTAEQLLTVQDITVPVFTFAPADTIVGCDAVPTPVLPTATDNCDAGVQIIYQGETVVSSTNSGTYTLQRTWTALDNCGNTAQVTQLLSVRDTVAPVIICPADIQVDADGVQCSAVVPFATPAVSDNCTTTPALVGSSASNAVFPIGTTVVVFEATDDSGNTASCSFSIVVA
ncbi:MAG: HYR domain-containing protein [Lewinellaceae bacterium]|nr:HYR domain-containing protein [Lewinellaceae bacterium]